MSFGPKTAKQQVVIKAKQWWEILHKVHLPEERARLSESDLRDLMVQLHELEHTIWYIQSEVNTELGSMVDFQRLRRYFFKNKGYKYGRKLPQESSEVENFDVP